MSNQGCVASAVVVVGPILFGIPPRPGRRLEGIRKGRPRRGAAGRMTRGPTRGPTGDRPHTWAPGPPGRPPGTAEGTSAGAMAVRYHARTHEGNRPRRLSDDRRIATSSSIVSELIPPGPRVHQNQDGPRMEFCGRRQKLNPTSGGRPTPESTERAAVMVSSLVTRPPLRP